LTQPHRASKSRASPVQLGWFCARKRHAQPSDRNWITHFETIVSHCREGVDERNARVRGEFYRFQAPSRQGGAWLPYEELMVEGI
jgi:hypothetical protein